MTQPPTIPITITCHDGTSFFAIAEYIGIENLTRHYAAFVKDTVPPVKSVRCAPLPMFTDVRFIAPGQVKLVHEALLPEGARRG